MAHIEHFFALILPRKVLYIYVYIYVCIYISYSMNGRDNEGVGMARDKISPKNLPRFFLTMT